MKPLNLFLLLLAAGPPLFLAGCAAEFPTALPLVAESDAQVIQPDPDVMIPQTDMGPDGGAVDARPPVGGETCNGADDDGDGQVDEGLETLPHEVQQGVCEGATDSCIDGRWRRDPIDGYDPNDPCDGLDNDCDGETDESWNVGADCVIGEGACRVTGKLECSDAGTAECAAEAAAGTPELCNGIDDDCDGQTDEEIASAPCDVEGALGLCRLGDSFCADGAPGCEPRNEASDERCDGEDNDCDGEVDNVPSLGGGCNVGVGECEADGVYACPDGPPPPGSVFAPDGAYCVAVPGEPLDRELCNDKDDDCDGDFDEDRACAKAITEHCRATFAWAAPEQGVTPAGPRPAPGAAIGQTSPAWPGCAFDGGAEGGEDDDSETACATTAGPGEFSTITIPAEDGLAGSLFGVSFRCASDDVLFPSEQALMVETNCNIMFGRTAGVAVEGIVRGNTWSNCDLEFPGGAFANSSRESREADECTAASNDGLVPEFAPLQLFRAIGPDSPEYWGIAFRCSDNFRRLVGPADDVQAFLAIGGHDYPAADGAQSWGRGEASCPSNDGGFASGADYACVGSGELGRFGAFAFPEGVLPNDDDSDLNIGIMLRLRPED